jgi:hypothetical protein
MPCGSEESGARIKIIGQKEQGKISRPKPLNIAATIFSESTSPLVAHESA